MWLTEEAAEERVARLRCSNEPPHRPAFSCLRIPVSGLPPALADPARLDAGGRELVLYRPVVGLGLPIAVERRGALVELLLPQIRL